MATYKKRGKTWQYTISRYVDGVYKPIRKGGFRTQKEASVEAIEIENMLNKRGNIVTRKISFADYYSEWLELYKKNVGERTLNRYLATHKSIEEYFGSIDIKNVDKRTYQMFINQYGETRTRSTVKKLNSHIRSCVKDAVDEGIIFVDFTRNVILSGKTTKGLAEKTLGFQNAMKLLDYLKVKCEQCIVEASLTGKPLDTKPLLLLVGLTTGMRFGEIVALTPHSFNFETNHVTIKRTWGYINRMPTGFGDVKNKESRTIKLSETIMKIIEDSLPHIHKNDYKLIFYLSSSKYQVHSNSGMNDYLKEICSLLSIESISLHGLRHTHASVMIYKKISIQYVSERLGHKDIATTYEYYIHLINELKKEDEDKTIDIFK